MEALEVSRNIYRRLAALMTTAPIRVRAWNGEAWGPEQAGATLVLNHPGAWRALLLPPTDLSAAEAYLYDDVDVEGEMLSLLEALAALEARPWFRLELARLMMKAGHLPSGLRRKTAARPRFGGRLHTLDRDRRAVTHHYDTGNEFFSLFLDPNMVYSCAHFLRPDEPLAVAQERKLDLICRKLRLSPGDRFLDVGCGWGALVAHAASRYGVEATGVTLSHFQAEWAERRAKELGVESRVTIIPADYRELKGSFDAIASVGMFEHVGRGKLSEYFKRLRALLAPGGALLNHGIVTRDRSGRRSRSFVRTYVFPDSALMPVEETINVAESSGFELRDAESLRASYALTARHWVTSLEANAEQAIAMVGDLTYRIWRLYMAGVVPAFDQAQIGVYQLLLTDPKRPWTFGRRSLLATDDR
ncbi:MAG: class I SAM-dependent methyltransferase [Actinomycetota bacterium]